MLQALGKFFKRAPGNLCSLLLCLSLLYLPYGGLYAPVGLLYNLLCLHLCLFQNLPLYLLYLRELLLIFVCYALQGSVCRFYSVQPLLYCAFVLGDFPQLPLNIHVVVACALLSLLHNLLRQSNLSCKFKCKGVARQPHLQFVERLYLCSVKHHCAINCASASLCKELEVCVVRGNHPKDAPSLHLREDCLRNGAARRRLCARTELVYKDKTGGVGSLQEPLHICKVRTVCAKVILNGLLISDIHKYLFKDAELRDFCRRNQNAPLEHILQQSGCLKADRFSARIWSRYY